MSDPEPRDAHEAERKRAIERKYDAGALDYSSRYADPMLVAEATIDLLRRSGTPLRPPARVIELGCGDGFITVEMVRAGYGVLALDLSSKMIEATRARLASEGLDAELRVGDIDSFEPEEEVDAILGVMRTFYAYSADPAASIARMAPWVRSKMVVDLNPRQVRPDRALEDLRAAGFERVQWSAFMVPQRVSSRALVRVLRAAGRVAHVRDLLLRKHFNVAALGERS